MDLVNSKRFLYSANHLSIKLTEEERRLTQSTSSGALKKAAFLRAIGVKFQTQDKLAEAVPHADAATMRDMKRLLAASKQLVKNPESHLEVAKSIATISDDTILDYAKSAASVEYALEHLPLLVDMYELQARTFPIGQLFLERLEMFPVGVERGELVFTVPMAPGESTTISHKEWSVSSRGYEDLVQDYFESFSERGVTEKIDTSSATENEVRRSNTLNFGATITGSYGPVSLTTTVGLNSASEDRKSVKTSMARNREVTEKSSARVRQEHKVSLKIESKQGVDDSSFKTITNITQSAVRIDYYRMMRKWRTDLFRYGLRLTYDITVPTPGVRLWARWLRVAEIDRQLKTPFQFGWTPDDIHEGMIDAVALELGILVEHAPPYQVTPPDVFDKTPWRGHNEAGNQTYGTIEFDVPPGYQLASAEFTANYAVWSDLLNFFEILNASDSSTNGSLASSSLPEHAGRTGHLVVSYVHGGVSQAALRVAFVCIRQLETWIAWQKSAWRMLRDAAEARHREKMARLQEERDTLWQGLVGKDTLSLRRLEREEMLRLVLLWLVGPGTQYSNAPSAIESIIDQMLAGEVAFFNGGPSVVPSATFDGLSRPEWEQAMLFGNLVKFIQQAVEWENLVYILYPYFWGSETQGRDKLLFEHADPEHQNFLRAGYCRVVVTVRPGFEEDFVQFVETGSLSGSYTSIYMTAAEEIAARARTNYAGIPPANPERHSRPLLYPQQRETWAIMEKVIGAIEQFKVDHGHYPPTLSDLPAGIKTDDVWGNKLIYSLPGSGNDYDLVSNGSNGIAGGEGTEADISAGAGASLMATWFDYTPTSGVDIVVNTKPAEIA